MAYLKINHEKIGAQEKQALIKICPFGAIVEEDGKLNITSACKTCKLCVKKGPAGCIEFVEEETAPAIDKSLWRDVIVFAEHDGASVHPVVLELLAKAKDLTKQIGHRVCAVWIGDSADGAEELTHYGADVVYTYTDAALKDFSVLPYARVLEDFIEKKKPCAMLVGATNIGRSLGPRIAARLRTGMTADCTMLEMKDNTDLVQIRPAFGGNIMARIVTPKTRPQFCTVREKVFSAQARTDAAMGELVEMAVPELPEGSVVNSVIKKEKLQSIADADVLVVAGRGVKKQEDLEELRKLADLLGGQLACTRPLVEAGWMPAHCQIGLSGRTVKPKLIITFGVSGAVQFAAGMKSSDLIVAINTDPAASIFDVAHVAINADLYEVVPLLAQKIMEAQA